MTNQFPGLARGPIDHNASSVINVIADGLITMGDAVQLKDINSISPVPPELLPRVQTTDQSDGTLIYGIAVGGDADGIYGDGADTTADINQATTAAGQGVVIVTQGRCLARVRGTIGTFPSVIGAPLTASVVPNEAGILAVADSSNDIVIARLLQPITTSGVFDIVAVDVQREGRLGS